MKLYVNGCLRPSFRVVETDGSTYTATLSNKYTKSEESYEKKTNRKQLLGGKKRKKFRFIDYEFLIYYAEYAENPDLLAIKRIEDSDSRGADIYVTPHLDCPWREIKVMVKDEKRNLTTFYHGGGLDGTPNKFSILAFENTDEILDIPFIDPNVLPIVSSISCEEF